jgi:hypothetical protein
MRRARLKIGLMTRVALGISEAPKETPRLDLGDVQRLSMHANLFLRMCARGGAVFAAEEATDRGADAGAHADLRGVFTLRGGSHMRKRGGLYVVLLPAGPQGREDDPGADVTSQLTAPLRIHVRIS